MAKELCRLAGGADFARVGLYYDSKNYYDHRVRTLFDTLEANCETPVEVVWERTELVAKQRSKSDEMNRLQLEAAYVANLAPDVVLAFNDDACALALEAAADALPPEKLGKLVCSGWDASRPELLSEGLAVTIRAESKSSVSRLIFRRRSLDARRGELRESVAST